MSYKVQSIVVFEKQAKRLIKKYASLKSELFELIKELKKNPQQGTLIGESCYKIPHFVGVTNKPGYLSICRRHDINL